MNERQELPEGSAMRGGLWDELRDFDAHMDWDELRRRFSERVAQTFERWIAPDEAHFREQLKFALGRFDEGAGLLLYFERYANPPPPGPEKSASWTSGQETAA